MKSAPMPYTVDFDHLIKWLGPNRFYWALVAEVENKVVAFAYLCEVLHLERTAMYLRIVLVTEKMRGKGKENCIDELIKLPREAIQRDGLAGIRLERTAINFYKKYPGVVFDNEWGIAVWGVSSAVGSGSK